MASEYCVRCDAPIGESGIYYLNKTHVCRGCFEQATMPMTDDPEPRLGCLIIAAMLAMAFSATLVAWVLG